MEIVTAVLIGAGLSAACGFRVFVPLLGMSIAVRFGYLEVSEGFSWIGSQPALIALLTATVLEIGAYCIPWLDNLLDMAAAPAAVIAGTLLTAAMVADLPPVLQWSLGLIAGGGAASAVQAATMLLRGGSTLITGGLGNVLIAAAELLAAVVTTLLAVFVPLLLGAAVLLAVPWVIWRIARSKRSRSRIGREADSPEMRVQRARGL